MYDDTWPIEWNTLAVANNVSVGDESGVYVKISNLAPENEVMESLIVTIDGITYPFYHGAAVDDYAYAATYAYSDFGIALVVVRQTGTHGNFEFSETGIYAESMTEDYDISLDYSS